MKANLGKIEQSIRLCLGTIGVAAVLASDEFGMVEGVALLLSVFLLLNGLTARCYLWAWLGLNSNKSGCDLDHAGGRRLQ
ncbi:MAG: YgaP-like transmembrane domain [Halieaceae bacterium]